MHISEDCYIMSKGLAAFVAAWIQCSQTFNIANIALIEFITWCLLVFVTLFVYWVSHFIIKNWFVHDSFCSYWNN